MKGLHGLTQNYRHLCCVSTKDTHHIVKDKACRKPVLGSLLPRIPIGVMENDGVHRSQVGAQAA